MIKNGVKIFAIVLLIIALSCSFKEPVLPSWFLPISIPLSEETFKLQELVNDSTIIAQGQDSLLLISIEGRVDSIGLAAEALTFEINDGSASASIGSIELDSLKDLRTEFTSLRDLLPGLTLLVGDTVTIPDTSLQFLSLQVESDDYKRIHVTSGSVTLRLTNNLPVPIGPNTAFALVNDSLNTPVVDITIQDTISPGQIGTGSDQIPSGGLWVYSKLRVDYDLPISGPTTVFVTDSLLDSTGFFIEVDFENFEADEIVARLQGQAFSSLLKFPLVEENRLKSGKVESGTVEIEFINNFDLESKVVFTLPNVLSQSVPVTDSVTLPPFGTELYSKVIDGFEVLNPLNPGEYIDSLSVDLAIFTNSTSNFVHITINDSISANIQSGPIYLAFFEGYFALDTLEVANFTEHNIADYGNFGQGVSLQNAELELSLLSEIAAENLYVEFDVVGYHENKYGVITDSATLFFSDVVNSNGSTGNPDIIVLNTSGSEVPDFLNILPTSMRGLMRVSMDGEGRMDRRNQVWADYLFSTPLRLRITGLDPIEGDVTTFIEEGDNNYYQGRTDTLSSDLRDRGEDFQNGELQLKLTNHTPLEVKIRMVLRKDLSLPDTTFFKPVSDSLGFEKSATLSAAPVNSQTGFVSAPLISDISLELTRDQVQMLTNPPYKVGYELTIFDTQGVVSLRSTDYAKSLGLAKIVVKIEDK